MLNLKDDEGEFDVEKAVEKLSQYAASKKAGENLSIVVVKF